MIGFATSTHTGSSYTTIILQRYVTAFCRNTDSTSATDARKSLSFQTVNKIYKRDFLSHVYTYRFQKFPIVFIVIWYICFIFILARNPPPFCVPIPVPYLPPGLVDMCVRLFDISFVEQKLHVCMDMDTRVDKAPVVVSIIVQLGSKSVHT